MERPQSFPQKALQYSFLLLWAAAAPAAGQTCTPDWGKCGWKPSATTACCSPLFTCEKKGDWYWQCVQKAPVQAPTLPPLPPPLPTVTLPPLPTTPSPEAQALASASKQLQNLRGDKAEKVAGDASRLSDVAAKLSAEGKAAAELAARLQRQEGEGGPQRSAAQLAAEAAQLSRTSEMLEEKTAQMAKASAGATREAQVAAQSAKSFADSAADVARLVGKLPGAPRLARRGHPLAVEVYYSPTGAHSRDFVRDSLGQLVRAGLPGDLVNVTVLPVVPRAGSTQECSADVDCSFARAQVCAMEALRQPTAADDKALRDFVDFLACDLSKTSRLEEGLLGCAKDNSRAMELQTCSEGRAGRAAMSQAAAGTAGVPKRLEALGLQPPPGKPWVFVGGRLVACREGGPCSAAGAPAKGGPSREHAADFLAYICHQLLPMPKACEEHLEGSGKPGVAVLPPPHAIAPRPAADAGRAPCPDDADLTKCIAWCKRVSPGSTPTLAGSSCRKMGTKELDFGMLPQCECYDKKMESVLKQCSSTCTNLQNTAGGAATTALEGVKTEMSPRRGAPIDVAVLYSTHCPACRDFIGHGLSQLMHAGLPGAEVNVSLLPMDAGSAMARTQLCAMRQTQLAPMSVDGTPLKKGLDYIACCDLAGGVDRATAQHCAVQTGFDWGVLERCAEGPAGREMAVAATRATAHVQEMLKGRGFVNPPGIPWVFVQGTLLRCSGALCAHEILPPTPGQQTNGLHEGGRPIAPGGGSVGFVEYVCSRLSPKPPVCLSAAAQRPAPPTTASSVPKACENCFSDLGHPLRWGSTPRASHALVLVAMALAAAAGAAVLLAAAVRTGLRRWRSPAEQNRVGFSLLAHPGSEGLGVAGSDATRQSEDVERAVAAPR